MGMHRAPTKTEQLFSEMDWVIATAIGLALVSVFIVLYFVFLRG